MLSFECIKSEKSVYFLLTSALFFTDHDFFLFLLIFGYNLSLISHMPKLLNTQTISQIKVIFLSQAVTFLSWVSAVFS